MMTGVAGAEEIVDSTLDRMASPTYKAFSESHLLSLMSLVLPWGCLVEMFHCN